MEFELTNAQRKYFGLDPVDKKWDQIELKKNVWAFFEADTLRKVIQIGQRWAYSEADYDLKTNQRKTLLPRTSRGKEKPLTPSAVEAYQSVHFSFSVAFDRSDEFKSSAFEASITNRNSASSRQIPTPCDITMKTFAELENWVNDFVKDSPVGYVKEITKLKKEKTVQIKYKSGDLFAFPLSRTTYGVGKILFPLKTIRDKGLVPEEHYFSKVMTVPLLVRLYGIEIPCENTLILPPMDIKQLKGKSLLPAYFMMDESVLRGKYPVVAHHAVVKEELDFPLSYDMEAGILCWGMGMTTIPVPLKTKIDPNTQGVMIRGVGVAGGAATHILEKYLKGEELYYEYEIRHPKNKKLYSEIFAAAGMPATITYDAFCKATQAPDREELIRLIGNK